MAYRLKRTESIAENFLRIAREEAHVALEAGSGGGPTEHRVHDARTCCKKLRGLQRLVRPHLGTSYRRENAFLRDAARSLSEARDAVVVRQTFEDLARRDRLGEGVSAAFRAILPIESEEARDGSQPLAGFAVRCGRFSAVSTRRRSTPTAFRRSKRA